MDTLTALYDWVLATSIRASLLTAIILILRALLRNRIPARWRYALWLPVLVVLLTPVFPETSWSIISITATPRTPGAGRVIAGRSSASLAAPSSAPTVQPPAPIDWRQISALVWLGGAVGLLCFGSTAFALHTRRLTRSRLPVGDALLGEVHTLAQAIGLRRAPLVCLSSAIRSPAVTGLFRPMLLLPAGFETTLAPHETRLVLKHELTHIKRGDLLVNALLCLLLALHWFNPLLWLAFVKARLDRESACDAQVLGGASQSQRAAYGHALLKVEATFGHHGLSLGFVGIVLRGADLRSRIQSIANPPALYPLMKPLLTLGIALLSFLGVTKAATPAPAAPSIAIATKFVEVSDQKSEPSDPTPLPAPLATLREVPALVGSLTDPELQALLRSLSSRKGVDLLSAPTLITKAGQQARVEVQREFIYPDQTVKVADKDRMKVGVTLAVLPTLTAHDQLSLDLSAQVVEFDGFADAKADESAPVVATKVLHPDGTTTESVSDPASKEQRESTFDAHGKVLSRTTGPLPKTARQPIFSRRKVAATVALAPGQTSILELDPRTDTQTVQETDDSGRIISSEIRLIRRRTFVFVTATLAQPAKDTTTGR